MPSVDGAGTESRMFGSFMLFCGQQIDAKTAPPMHTPLQAPTFSISWGATEFNSLRCYQNEGDTESRRPPAALEGLRPIIKVHVQNLHMGSGESLEPIRVDGVLLRCSLPARERTADHISNAGVRFLVSSTR